jgi:hypothetical protein
VVDTSAFGSAEFLSSLPKLLKSPVDLGRKTGSRHLTLSLSPVEAEREGSRTSCGFDTSPPAQ